MCSKQQAKISHVNGVRLEKVQSLRQVEKAQRITVAWPWKKKKKRFCCVDFRTVLVGILWRRIDHCECWTCAWLLSLIVTVLILSCTAKAPSTVFTVRTNTSQSMVNLSPFTVIPADAKKVANIFDILCKYWILVFLLLKVYVYIYSSVCL